LNKVTRQKAAAKKRQAFSYQLPYDNTLTQTSKKQKLDLELAMQQPSTTTHQPSTAAHEPSSTAHEPSTSNHEPSTSNHLVTDSKPIIIFSNAKPKSTNFCVACQKVVQTNMSQHKKGIKHQKNEYWLEIIYKKDDIHIQRIHFLSLQTRDEWLSVSIICGFLKALELPSTIIINYALAHMLINEQRSPYLDRFKIHDFKFIAGPHLVNNNHWLALIINIENRKFMLLDPLNKQSLILDTAFASWSAYYKTRRDQESYVWKKETIDHPMQSDNFNCGVFVMNFIKQFILTSKIDFTTDPPSLMAYRFIAETKIKEYFIKE
jgi:hypothetical protein